VLSVDGKETPNDSMKDNSRQSLTHELLQPQGEQNDLTNEPKISSKLIIKKQLPSVASRDQEVRSSQGLRGTQHR